MIMLSNSTLAMQVNFIFLRKTHSIQIYIHIQSDPKKCVHSLLISKFGINLNEISISG